MKGKRIEVGPKNKNRTKSRGIWGRGGCLSYSSHCDGERCFSLVKKTQTNILHQRNNLRLLWETEPAGEPRAPLTSLTVPYLAGALEPMLCCKLVRLVLRVLAQLHEKMVRQDSARSPRSEQQHRAQHRYQSRRRCPVSGRSVHRVRLLVVGPPARPSICEG